MKMTINDAENLQAEADKNEGHCPTCEQTIKIYRYKVNKSAAIFMRAMALKISGDKDNPGTGVNDVDISTIGIPYSVRTQVSKLRQHGLIARIRNTDGAQIASRWLVTNKGWAFINGQPIPAKVVVYNNQVLGHDGGLVTIHGVLGEKFDPEAATYTEAPVGPVEARLFNDARQPKKKMELRAKFRGSRYSNIFKIGEAYDLTIDRLTLGHPVRAVASSGVHEVLFDYRDIAAFNKDWRVI